MNWLNKKCPKCGIPGQENAQFCSQCGTNLSARVENDRQTNTKCPICNTNNLENSRFCVECGTNFDADITQRITVGFVQAIGLGFSNYFNFSGRAIRSEYWWWVLFASLIQLIPIIGGLIGLATVIPTLAITSRRLHDIGKTGWWQLLFVLVIFFTTFATLGFIIFVGFANASGENKDFPIPAALIAVVGVIIVFFVIAGWIVWMARPGQIGPNKYGPDMKHAN